MPSNKCFAASVDANVAQSSSATTIEQKSQQATSNAIGDESQQQQPKIQSRSGPIDPVDYLDDGNEFEALANQQQIPTAQLMSAAGHVVPENFFLPGGSIPANQYAPMQRVNVPAYLQQNQPNSNIAQSPPDIIHSIHARHAPTKYGPRQASSQAAMDLLTSASTENETPLIDFNGYNLATQPDGREVGAPQVDLVEFLNEQRDYQGPKFQQQHLADQQMPDAFDAMASVANQRGQEQQQQQAQTQQQRTHEQQMMASNEQMSIASDQYSQSIGPDYQIIGQPQNQPQAEYIMVYNGPNEYQSQKDQSQQKPYGLPTMSSSREPTGMLKPSGNPKTISSPIIDFAANQLPKNTVGEKIGEKIPQTQTPTVFKFSSSKDPTEKGKAVFQKKRNVMRQAEQMARMAVKAFNERFGTNLGDQTDIPFLLSTLGPLGIAQNVLFDPTLWVTLINSAERAYMSDVLPGPAKVGFRTVLNAFRVPNKKRDKANLLNIISYLASGGQTPSIVPSKHRQGTGIEKSVKSNKNKR